MSNTKNYLHQLESGESYSFGDWPNNKAPLVAAGVYTIWQNDRIFYAGMAGRGLSEAEIKASRKSGKSKKGLFRRLASHASGRRSGNQFCIYVCDRFVVPRLTPEQQQQLAEGKLSLDQMTREFIRRHFTYRFVVVADPSEVLDLERQVRAGAMSSGLPFLNPLSQDRKRHR